MNAQQKKEMEAKIKDYDVLDFELRKTEELIRFLRVEIKGDLSEQGRITKIEIHRERWSTNPPHRIPLKTPLSIVIPFDEFLFRDVQIADWMIPILQAKAEKLRKKMEAL